MANQLCGKNYSKNKIKFILYIFFYWFLLVLLGFYFANNTLYLDKVGGVSLTLFISIISAFGLESVFLFIKKNKNDVFINKSLFFLFLLVLYISLRIVIDKSDFDYLRSFWFSTTLGCLLFYILGVLIAYVTAEDRKSVV